MVTKIWEDKLENAKINYQSAKKELELAELELKESKKKTGIENWLGYTFESSSRLTPEFAQFRKEIKRYITKLLDKNLKLIMPFGTLHFAFSGFIKNKLTNKFVYFSCMDVRYSGDAWYNDLSIKTAENEKDYRGRNNNSCKLPEGRNNNSCKLPDLSKKALLLTL